MSPLRIWIGVTALGAMACGGPTSAGEDPCGTGTFVAGGTSEHPTSYALGSEVDACMGTGSEIQYYEVTAADDRTGGYVQATVTGGGSGTVSVTAYAGTGTAALGRFLPATAGGATTFYLAVAPRQAYHLAVANEGAFAEPFTFKLATVYTPVPDEFEPNDTLTEAKVVTLGTPLQAYLFGGRQGADDDPAVYDDYYRFSAAGTVTISIDELAPDLAPRITLFTAGGSELARLASGIKGGALVMQSPMLVGPADFVVRIAPWSTAPPSMGPGPLLPDHFTRPYKLNLTQP